MQKSPRSYTTSKLLAQKKSAEISSQRVNTINSFGQKVREIDPYSLLSTKSRRETQDVKIQKKPNVMDSHKIFPVIPSFPCLFVTSLEQKNEVLGTSLMNRFVRLLTKKGKKSQAFLFLEKTYTLLAQFEAEKKRNQNHCVIISTISRISSESKNERVDNIRHSEECFSNI